MRILKKTFFTVLVTRSEYYKLVYWCKRVHEVLRLYSALEPKAWQVVGALQKSCPVKDTQDDPWGHAVALLQRIGNDEEMPRALRDECRTAVSEAMCGLPPTPIKLRSLTTSRR